MENNKHKKEVEDGYKNKLYNLEAEPSATAWDNIFVRIQEPNKKKRPLAFWWSGILLGLAFLCGLFFYLNLSKKSLSASKEIGSMTPDLHNAKEMPENTTASSNKEPLTTYSAQAAQEVPTSNALEQKSAQNAENPTLKAKNVNQKGGTSENSIGHTAASAHQISAPVLHPSEAPALAVVGEHRLQETDKKPNETFVPSVEASTSPQEAESGLLQQKPINIHALHQALDKLTSRNTAIETPEVAEKFNPIAIKRARKQVKCFNFMKYNKISYLSAYVSGGYGLRTLTARAQEYDDYRNRREASEKSDYFIGAGVEYAQQFSRYWLVRGGLDVQQQEETFIIVHTAYTKDVITRIEDAITGQVTYDTTTQVGLYEERNINRYRSLSLPIVLGYDFAKNRSGLTVYAGGTLQLLATQSGSIYDQTGTKLSLNADADETAFMTNLNFSAQVSAQGYFYFNKNYRVFAEPFVQYKFGEVTQKNNPIAQKYINFGCKLGISRLLY